MTDQTQTPERGEDQWAELADNIDDQVYRDLTKCLDVGRARAVLRSALIAAARGQANSPDGGAVVSGSGGEALARLFHETYERMAPSFGYETRPDTKAFDPESANGKLMIAVCSAIATPSPEPATDKGEG